MPRLRHPYVLFDWDGCLAATLEIWLGAFRTAFGELDLHPTDAQIGAHIGDLGGDAKLGVRPEDQERFTARLYEVATAGLPAAELYEGARATLVHLREAGARTALVSSSRRTDLDTVLTRHGLHALFDAIVSADDVTAHKPDAEPLVRALSLLGGTAGDAVMIGDSDKDLGAANNAGTASVLMFPAGHALFYDEGHLRSFGPAAVCGLFAELDAYLLEGE